MADVKVYEDDQKIIWQTTTGTPGTPGSTRDEWVEHKPGSPDYNRTFIEDQARQALETNRAFVALTGPTNAQVLAQTKALSRQINGIIRVLLNQFDGTD